MDDGSLSSALSRAELALERVERSLADYGRVDSKSSDEALRERIREVVAELDELIRDASRG